MSKLASMTSAPTGEDKELLELASKAAQLKLRYSSSEGFSEYGDIRPWNPLIDDGDALRLAVALQFDLSLWGTDVFVRKDGLCLAQEFSRPDRFAATRRAIVRAAAEIGRAMR